MDYKQIHNIDKYYEMNYKGQGYEVDVVEAQEIDGGKEHAKRVMESIKDVIPEATINLKEHKVTAFHTSVDAINVSLTGSLMMAYQRAYEQLKKDSVALITSAGNSGKDGVSALAWHNKSIAVASGRYTKHDGYFIPSYSSRGEQVDITCIPRDGVAGTSHASPVFTGVYILLKQRLEANGYNKSMNEIVKMLYDNAMRIESVSSESQGKGVAILPKDIYPKDVEGHWGEEALKWMIDKGYMTGYDDGLMYPDKPMTRAMYAQAKYNEAKKRGEA